MIVFQIDEENILLESQNTAFNNEAEGLIDRKN